MPNLIKIKRTDVASRAPTAGQLEYGELAINYTDGKLFYKDNTNTIKQIGAQGATGPTGPTGVQGATGVIGVTGATGAGLPTYTGNVVITGSAGVSMTLNGPAGYNAFVVNVNSTNRLTVDDNGRLLVSGPVRAGSGEVAVPSYSFTGSSTNTGMWSPAAGVLAFSAGGLEAVRVAGNGNVGVGTTDPQEKLAVFADNNNGRTSILIDNLDQRLKFSAYYAAGVAQYAEIQGWNNAENSATWLVLNRQGGNVGVGTATPGSRFEVNTPAGGQGINSIISAGAGTVNYALMGHATGSATANTGVYANVSGATSNYGVRIVNPPAGANNWAIYSDAGAKSYFAGDVGVGTTSPAYTLHVSKAGNHGIGITSTDTLGAQLTLLSGVNSAQLAQSSTVTYLTNFTSGGAIAFTQAGAGYITFQTNNVADRLRITSAGDIGIGVAAPAAKLDVNGTINGQLKVTPDTRSAPAISSGALTLNLANGSVFSVSMTANITSITIQNVPAGTNAVSFTLVLTATGTARTVIWPASVKWADGVVPTLTVTNGKIDVLTFLSVNNGTNWLGFIGGQNF